MKEDKQKDLVHTGVRLSEDKIDNMEILQDELLGYISALNGLKDRRKTRKVREEERMYLINIKDYTDKLRRQVDNALFEAGEDCQVFH